MVFRLFGLEHGFPSCRVYWAALKELSLSRYIGETILVTVYTHYANLIQVPYKKEQQPSLVSRVQGLMWACNLQGESSTR